MRIDIELKPGERIDELQRNGYGIIQSESNFRFGMDAVLLSGFAKVKRGEIAVDLGTGTGIIPLILSHKTQADLIAGKIHTFDTSTFTVNGEELTSYMADVDTDAAYEPDHEVVLDGYFHESGEGFRSAPYFNVEIDGIKLLDSAY